MNEQWIIEVYIESGTVIHEDKTGHGLLMPPEKKRQIRLTSDTKNNVIDEIIQSLILLKD